LTSWARPYALWLRGRGDLRSACLQSVSVVGSRAATGYGVHVAGEIAADLGQRGWAIVSGGAYGIDAAAHRGALITNTTTVAVLACGVDYPYPAGHMDLFADIAAAGLVISEWPPGRHPARRRPRPLPDPGVEVAGSVLQLEFEFAVAVPGELLQAVTLDVIRVGEADRPQPLRGQPLVDRVEMVAD
jgi:hypothetical protein